MIQTSSAGVQREPCTMILCWIGSTRRCKTLQSPCTHHWQTALYGWSMSLKGGVSGYGHQVAASLPPSLPLWNASSLHALEALFSVLQLILVFSGNFPKWNKGGNGRFFVVFYGLLLLLCFMGCFSSSRRPRIGSSGQFRRVLGCTCTTPMECKYNSHRYRTG
jgi:hypothetical protein